MISLQKRLVKHPTWCEVDLSKMRNFDKKSQKASENIQHAGIIIIYGSYARSFTNLNPQGSCE